MTGEDKKGWRCRQLPDWTKKLFAAVFWLAVWQVLAHMVDSRILIASPMETVRALVRLIGEQSFWSSVLFSLLRIQAGFLLAVFVGSLLAAGSYFFSPLGVIFLPFFRLLKAIPIASCVILALLWIRSENLSILIAFLFVIPIIYINVLQGLKETDRGLLEMAQVYRLPFLRRLRYIYLPSVYPYLVSACSLGIGFCWKSGVSAEVIGLPRNSIGRRLYDAKLYLMTDELFAWTAVIILVSVAAEALLTRLLKRLLLHEGARTEEKSGRFEGEA